MPVVIAFELTETDKSKNTDIRGELLKLGSYKAWLSDDDDGECLAIPNNVLIALFKDEDSAREDFESQLDKLGARDRLYSVIYTKLSPNKLFFAASPVGDGECDWESGN